jgi:hypothetical protein
MAVVYRHIRLDKNVPFYIGIGKTENRAYQKNNRNDLWKNIINQTEYRVDMLFNNLPWDKACEKEKELIKLYGRKDLGTGTLCNMTDGGEGILGAYRTEETKRKISQAQKGEKNHNYGKKHPEEVKRKIRKGNLGKKQTPEAIEKIKKSKVGIKLPKRTQIHSERQSLTHQKPIKPEYRKDRDYWFCRARRNGKRIYLGCFKTEQEAWDIIKEYEKNGKIKKVEKRINPWYVKNTKKWLVRFIRNRKEIYLGYFKTEQESWNAIEEWKKNNEKVLSP